MDLKTFKDEINLLDEQHKKHIDSGAKPSDFSDGYKQRIESLIHQSVSSDEWPDIIKHIAFLIYAGGFSEIANEKTTHVVNQASEAANRASSVATVAVKRQEEAEKRAMMATREGIVASARAHRLAEDLKSAPSRAALKAAKAKLAKDKDGKQEAKRFVEDCWKDWQKKPDSYSGQAEFARDMLSKCENLKSQPAIENWCREWKKKNTH